MDSNKPDCGLINQNLTFCFEFMDTNNSHVKHFFFSLYKLMNNKKNLTFLYSSGHPKHQFNPLIQKKVQKFYSSSFTLLQANKSPSSSGNSERFHISLSGIWLDMTNIQKC